MAQAKKEEGKVKSAKDPKVETPVGEEKAKKSVEMNDEQRNDFNSRTASISKLMERELWDKAKSEIDDLPDYGFEGLKDTKEQLTKELAAAKRRAQDREKAEKKAETDPNRVTLESVEKKLFDLSAEVDLLTKARAKSGKPNRQLAVLKKRLDTMILFYTKFQKRSTN